MIIKSTSKTMLLAILAVISGAIAAFSLLSYVNGKIAQAESRSHLVMVDRIVAAKDLPAGTKLVPEHLAIRSFPEQWLSTDSLPISHYESLNGKVLTVSLRGGELFLPVHVLAPKNALSTSLAPGRRAITLSVDVVNSLSGLLHPGDLIDLYVTFNYQKKSLTAPLLQGVLVMATGKETITADYDNNLDNYSSITLEAAPEDIVKLVAARQAGSLTAILRNPMDSVVDTTASRGDLAALLGISIPAPIKKNKAVVMYGGSKAVGIPAWARPENGMPKLTNGLFDIPYGTRISSDWVDADELNLGETINPYMDSSDAWLQSDRE